MRWGGIELAVRSIPYVSEAEYLQAERQAQTKSEYLTGQVFALAGASRAHNRLKDNIGGMLYSALRGSGCEFFTSDMRVRVVEASAYFYPDVVIVCGELQFEDEHQDVLLNPLVIFEVLSASTESFDRGEKFFAYRRLASLREYVLVSQDKLRVEHFIRQEGGEWLLREYAGADGVVRLESVAVELPMALVYEGVSVRQEQEGE